MKDEYKKIAPLYDMLLDGFNEGLRGIGLKLYTPDKGMAVLDVCCGTGAQLEPYRKHGCRVMGVDRSPAMLTMARKRLGSGSVVEADAGHLPFPDASFDLALCTLALHEMSPADRVRTLSEMKRILRQEGFLLLTDFHPGPYRFLKGWLTASGIFMAELMAGKRHFLNGRQFLREGGIGPIAGTIGLSLVRKKIVGGGTFGVTLFSPTERGAGT